MFAMGIRWWIFGYQVKLKKKKYNLNNAFKFLVQVTLEEFTIYQKMGISGMWVDEFCVKQQAQELVY